MAPATYISGQSFVTGASASNFGSMFVGLKEYSERRDPKVSSDAIAQYLRDAHRGRDSLKHRWASLARPRCVGALEGAGGFALMIEDRGDIGPQVLQQETDNITRKGFDLQGLAELGYQVSRPMIMFTVFRANVPQLTIDPDPRECMTKGIASRRLCFYHASLRRLALRKRFQPSFGRTWQVIVQADKANSATIQANSPCSRATTARRHGTAWSRWPKCARSMGRWCWPVTTIGPPLRSTASPSGPYSLPGQVMDFDAEASASKSAATEHGLRMDGHVLSGAEGRQHRHDHFRLCGGHGVSGVGRPV